MTIKTNTDLKNKVLEHESILSTSVKYEDYDSFKTSTNASLADIIHQMLSKLTVEQLRQLIGFADINKNLSQIDSTMLTPSLLAMIAGNAGVNVTPLDLSVLSRHLANFAVTPEKTSFINHNMIYTEKTKSITGSGTYVSEIVVINGWQTGKTYTAFIGSVVNNTNNTIASLDVYNVSNVRIQRVFITATTKKAVITIDPTATRFELVYRASQDTPLVAGVIVTFTNIYIVDGEKLDLSLQSDVKLSTENLGSKSVTIDKIQENVFKATDKGFKSWIGDWELGAISTNNGTIYDSATLVRTKTFFEPTTDFNIYLKTGYTLTVLRYDKTTKTFIDWFTQFTSGKILLNQTYAYKFMIVATNFINLDDSVNNVLVAYNRLGFLTPNNGSISVTYNGNNQATQITEIDGLDTITTTINYTNGLISQTVETNGIHTITTVFQYDGNDNLITVTRSVV